MTSVNKNEKRPESIRTFHCPDGVTRLIVLEEWYWHALDWILTKGETIDEIVSFCWNLAKDHDHDPEYEFKATLAYYIHRATRYYVSVDDDLANDDWFNPDFITEICS